MKFTEILDLVQRRINSILFRIIICFYSSIVIYNNENILSNIYYWIAISVYFLVYIALLKAPITRLTNDFVFIGFILVGKDPNHPVNFLLLLLPIINSINFSGEKKSILLYVYTFSFYILLIYYYKNKPENLFESFEWYNLIPIVILWVINSYTSLRVKIRVFRELLNDVVDGFYLKKEYLKKPYKVYNEIINAIHNTIKEDIIEGLFCFIPSKTNDGKITIVNGSTFLWKYKFVNRDFITRLRDKRQIINEPLIFDDIEKPNNLILYTRVENEEYIFAFVTKKNIPMYYIIIGFFRTLEPAFTKIAKVLLNEKKLVEIRNEEIQRMAESSQYVNRANKTMHFVRNRLNPLSNLLKMLDNLSNIPTDKEKAFQLLLTSEIGRTKIDLRGIIERADDMLEKSSNPFVFTDLKPVSLQRIYTTLKRISGLYFTQLEIKVDVPTDGIKRFAYLNEEGLELFLTDWLNNMSKYKKSHVDIQFAMSSEFLNISFINDHYLTPEDVSKLIDDLTLNNRNEIMRRTTHGLLTIKTTLEEMQVPYKISSVSDNQYIEFLIKIKTFEDENSSI